MSTYLLATTIILIVIFLLDDILKIRLYRNKKFYLLMAITIMLTVGVDNLNSLKVYDYDPGVITNIFVGSVPIENILFGVCLIYLNILVFEYFRRKILR